MAAGCLPVKRLVFRRFRVPNDPIASDFRSFWAPGDIDMRVFGLSKIMRRGTRALRILRDSAAEFMAIVGHCGVTGQAC